MENSESQIDAQRLNDIIQIFEEVLAVNPVEEDDHFFHLGGRSLLAMRVVARVHKVFQIRVSVKVLFDHPTPLAFSERIRQLSQ